MTLRQLFARFAGILLLLQVLCALITTAAVVAVDGQNAFTVTRTELQRVFKEHEQELAGNLMLGHKCLVEHQLNRIADREGIRVGLQSALYAREIDKMPRRHARSDFSVVLADEPYGTLSLAKAISSYRSLAHLGIALGSGQLMIFLGAMGGLYLWSRRFLLRPLEGLAACEGAGIITRPSVLTRWMPREIEQIGTSLTELWQRREQHSNEVAIVKMSKQVAHDIRSPITALEVLVQESQDMPEDRRMLLEGAAHRIRDIADSLLNMRGKAVDLSAPLCEKSTVVVWPLVEAVAAEKRCEYRMHRRFVVRHQVTTAGMAACVTLSRSDLARVLSNLVNNAAEACNGVGQVSIQVDCGKMVEILVQDSGPGMPEEMVRRLDQGLDLVSTKAHGHGLGLAHARSLIQQAGGTLRVESDSSGTTIKLSLPAGPVPAWLARELVIPHGGQVHVLDDDESIHQVWRMRSNENAWVTSGIKLCHHTVAQSLREKVGSDSAQPIVCLVDYDLKAPKNGLETIQETKLESVSYLVTSRYDDPSVQQQCEDLGVKLVPKSLAPRIPVRIIADDKTQLKTAGLPYVFVVRREEGQQMESCMAENLEDARAHALDLLRRNPMVSEVKVLDKMTHDSLGSVAAHDHTWRPSPNFPLRRMTWH